MKHELLIGTADYGRYKEDTSELTLEEMRVLAPRLAATAAAVGNACLQGSTEDADVTRSRRPEVVVPLPDLV